MTRPFLLLATLLALSFSLPAQDQPAPPAKTPHPAPEPAETKIITTEHTVTIGGQPVSYHASTGYLVLKDEVEKGGEGGKGGGEKDGPGPKDSLKPKARIFFIAYTRSDVRDPATRPLTFAFNGGPGAASVWLHLGALGPRRVKLDASGSGTPAPYHLVDNDASWLDQTDLVFIDPVSTGYSRPAPGEPARAFYSYQEDLQSISEFIRLYTTQNNRWLSPKLLVGESYGGLRAAALAGLLQEKFDLYVNAIVIVSGVLNWQCIDFHRGNDLAFALFLPAYAAAAQYHHQLAPAQQQRPGADLRAEVEKFAMETYWPALAKGSALPETERASLIQSLVKYTGISEEIWRRYELRFPASDFMDELLRKDRRSIGRFDSRLTGLTPDPEGSDFDPSFTTMRGNFTASINAYMRSELKFETELPYRSLASVGPWNFGAENRYLDVGDSLTHAMSRDPRLKAWVLTGTYDLAISYFSTDYSLRQLRLPPEVRPNIRFSKYESGHMLYTDETVLHQLKTDFTSFLSETLK